MNTNPYFIERMIHDKLADLHSEAQHSHLLAQASLQRSRPLIFLDLRRLFQRLLGGMTRHSQGALRTALYPHNTVAFKGRDC